MVMTSGIPEGGRVLSVSIYPTEFGLKCMRVEAAIGPSALIGADCEEDSDFEAENNKLRTSLNRRRLATKHRDTFADYHLVYFSVCLGLNEKSLNAFFNSKSIIFSC
jgi:hypothetical protein